MLGMILSGLRARVLVPSVHERDPRGALTPDWALPGFQLLPLSCCVSGTEGNDLDAGTVHVGVLESCWMAVVSFSVCKPALVVCTVAVMW